MKKESDEVKFSQRLFKFNVKHIYSFLIVILISNLILGCKGNNPIDEGDLGFLILYPQQSMTALSGTQTVNL